jgi:uncharacterized protein YceH (UPF0502 family)
MNLTPVEVRVLGCLIEKEITTPEYYPLSLNALVNACNQKSNREPIMSLNEPEVEDALASLREQGFTTVQTGSRVSKYGHRFIERLNLGRRETAVLCELMLRSPQTVGELRTRADRMYHFDDLEQVEAVLRHLIEQNLVARLDRGRFSHLLSGAPVAEAAPPQHAGSGDRLAALEAELASLRSRVEALEAELGSFRRQFE